MDCQRCGNALAPGARFCNACGTPVPETPATKRGGGGAAVVVIIVVVVFFVVAFAGIIAAIAIPNFLSAKQRAMQRRTMAEMRRAAMTSVEEYRASHDKLPDSIPAQKDAWGHDLRYKSDGTSYWIVSAGKDGRFEEDDPSRYTAGTTTNFDADLVLQNGEMLRAPAGVGRRRD